MVIIAVLNKIISKLEKDKDKKSNEKERLDDVWRYEQIEKVIMKLNEKVKKNTCYNFIFDKDNKKILSYHDIMDMRFDSLRKSLLQNLNANKVSDYIKELLTFINYIQTKVITDKTNQTYNDLNRKKEQIINLQKELEKSLNTGRFLEEKYLYNRGNITPLNSNYYNVISYNLEEINSESKHLNDFIDYYLSYKNIDFMFLQNIPKDIWKENENTKLNELAKFKLSSKSNYKFSWLFI